MLMKYMHIALPEREAADLTRRAQAEGVPLPEYLGVQALAGAYGLLHPLVRAHRKRAKAGQTGTKTAGAGSGVV